MVKTGTVEWKTSLKSPSPSENRDEEWRLTRDSNATIHQQDLQGPHGRQPEPPGQKECQNG